MIKKLQKLQKFEVSCGSEIESEQKHYCTFLEYLYHGTDGGSGKRTAIIKDKNFNIFIPPPPHENCTKETLIQCMYQESSKSKKPTSNLKNNVNHHNQINMKNNQHSHKKNLKENSNLLIDNLSITNTAIVYPFFLETSFQSHPWIFSAVAELIDNALDAKASILCINVVNQNQLIFYDSGSGMTYEELAKMLLQFGNGRENNNFIGRYGIGFKSGSMRLGKDVMIFTKSDKTQSLALFSQTLNANNNYNSLNISIINWKKKPLEFDTSVYSEEELREKLNTIYKISPFKNDFQISEEFAKIKSKTGTRIIIWNLNDELDFTTDPEDIRIKQVSGKNYILKEHSQISNDASIDVPIDYSLRRYCELLYLKPTTQLYIQNKKVMTKLVADSLSKKKIVSNPKFSVKMVLGLSSKDKENNLGGFHIYWHNRLVESYVRVADIQNKKVNGIIGIIECNKLVPIRYKQSFFYNEDYKEIIEKWAANEFEKYYNNYFNKDNIDKDVQNYEPDLFWVQCNKCLKWRKLLPGTNISDINELWKCNMNEDIKYNSCQIPQEDSILDSKTIKEENVETINDSNQNNIQNINTKKHRTKDILNPKQKKSLIVIDE
jgi:hypothetical protein